MDPSTRTSFVLSSVAGDDQEVPARPAGTVEQRGSFFNRYLRAGDGPLPTGWRGRGIPS